MGQKMTHVGLLGGLGLRVLKVRNKVLFCLIVIVSVQIWSLSDTWLPTLLLLALSLASLRLANFGTLLSSNFGWDSDLARLVILACLRSDCL